MQLRNRLIGLNIPLFLAAITILPIFVLFVSRGSNAIFSILSFIPAILLILDRQWPQLYHLPLNRIFCVWFIFAIISLSWTLDPVSSTALLLQLFLLYFSAIALFYYLTLLTPVTHRAILRNAIGGLLIALFLANIEIIYNGAISSFLRHLIHNKTDFLLTDLNRAAVVISLLVWPVFGYFILTNALKYHYLYAGLFFIFVTLTITRLESQSSTAAVFIGLLIWLFICLTDRIGVYLLMAATAVAIISIPIFALHMDPEYILQTFPVPENAAPEYRLHIWNFAAQKATIHPWLGWGFNSSRSIPVQPQDYLSDGRHPLPLHPHNNILQIWLEFGALGLFAFFVFIIRMMQHILHFTYRQHRALAMALMGSFFMIGSTGYGIWQHWFIASGIMAVLLLAIVFKLDQTRTIAS